MHLLSNVCACVCEYMFFHLTSVVDVLAHTSLKVSQHISNLDALRLVVAAD